MQQRSFKPLAPLSAASASSNYSGTRTCKGKPGRRGTRRRFHQHNSLWRKTPVQAVLRGRATSPASAKVMDGSVYPVRETQPESVLDTWDRVQDLLLRATRLCPVRVWVSGFPLSLDSCTLSFVGFKDAWWEGKALALRHALLDVDSYAWQEGGRSGSFLNLLEYQGSDLVVHLTSWVTLKGFPQGEGLACLVLGLLMQLSDTCTDLEVQV